MDVSKILDPRGIWVIQQNYLPTMLEQNGFDNIGHEHLTYFSLQTLSLLLTERDLEIFDVETNDVNGGSFRTYVSHKDRFRINMSVSRLKDYENKLFSRRPSIYKECDYLHSGGKFIVPLPKFRIVAKDTKNLQPNLGLFDLSS